MAVIDRGTITKYLDIQVPSSITLSADGKTLVYATGYDRKGIARDTEHRVQTLWVAESGKAGSAKQLTSGLYNDTLPAISPDGKAVVFVSDRAKKGESSALYSMCLSGGEPIPITPKDNEQAIEAVKWSPDSRHVAYISPDEKTSERKERDKKKDDVAVFGEDLFYNRLRTVQLDSRTLTTISSIDEHITDFDWSYNGDRIAFVTTQRPDMESLYCLESKIFTVASDGSDKEQYQSFPTWIYGITYTSDAVYFCGAVHRESVVSSYALYKQDLTADATARLIACGEADCCETVKCLGKDVAIQVQNGLHDELRIDGGSTLVRLPTKIMSWNAAYTKDSDEVIVALATGDINHPAEVYTKTASGGALVKLSNHGEAFVEDIASTTFFECKSPDDKDTLEGVFYTPIKDTSNDKVPSKPLSTMVWVHGGPYSRLTDTNNPGSFYFVNLALKLGYAVMLPNYRGGSGRGEHFASKARGLMGVYDEPDVVAMTQHCIEQGWIDKESVIIAGWSQGGHISYLAAVRNGMHGFGWKYKAAIPGAGVTDWDTMSFTSDVGPLQADFAGVPAWTTQKDNVQNRTGSAIWEFRKAAEDGVIPPMLILHGEKDERVPLEQAVAFRRALDHYKLPYEMAVYPREPHTIKERYHVEDMIRRFTRTLQKHLA